MMLLLLLSACGSSNTEKDVAMNDENFREADVVGDIADLPPNEDNFVQAFANIDNPKNYNILTLAAKDDNFATFRRLAKMGNLGNMLSPDKEYTVFMPTNAAFQRMPEEKFEKLVDPRNRTSLNLFLQRHILIGEHSPMSFNDSQAIETNSEEEITIGTNSTGELSIIGGAGVVGDPTYAANGIIYAVDAVVQPTKDVFSE